MKKLIALTSILLLTSCASSPSSSSSSLPPKGEEVVKTVDKATFEKIITNKGLIDIPNNVTLSFVVSGMQGAIKIHYEEVEFSEAYVGEDPVPVKYYVINEDRATVYPYNPYTGKLAGYFDVSHDEAIEDLSDAVGIVGPSFTYEQFSFVAESGAYHADKINLANDHSMTDVNFYFENNLLVKATAKENADDGVMDINIEAHDYGTTNLNIPY